MKPVTLAVCLFTLGTSGCLLEPVLVPDRAAQRVAGNNFMAFAELEGVRVYADGNAWRGDPLHLAQVLTPVSITLENRSQRPLRVSYADLRLVGSSGFVYPVLAPMPGRSTVSSIEGGEEMIVLADYHPARPVPRAPRYPRFRHNRFYVAPHYRYFYPGYFAWPSAFAYDPGYYDRVTWPSELPTADMLAEALPEGVLQSGGSVQGFVYFQHIAERESQVRLELKLVGADNNQSFGAVALPFVVRAR